MNIFYTVCLIAMWLISVAAWRGLENEHFMIISNIYIAGLLVVGAIKS